MKKADLLAGRQQGRLKAAVENAVSRPPLGWRSPRSSSISPICAGGKEPGNDEVARAKSKRWHVIDQDAADDRAAGVSFVGKVQARSCSRSSILGGIVYGDRVAIIERAA
jgi:hypothetical protein